MGRYDIYKRLLYRLYRKITVTIILPSYLLFVVFNCNNNRADIKEGHILNSIDFEKNVTDTAKIDLLNIAKNIYVISLEKSPESIVGNIHNIAAGSGHVLLGTTTEYFLFTDKGFFVRRPFSSGRGPGEVLNPIFYPQIDKNKIWFYDQTNNRCCINGYDIFSGIWETVEIQPWGNIVNLLVSSDTSISYISRIMHIKNQKITFDFFFIEQNNLGELQDSICIGKDINSNFLSTYMLKARDGGIYIMSPRGDSLMYFNGKHKDVIWRNYLKPIENNSLRPQKITGAFLLHYSMDTLLFFKYERDVDVKSSRISHQELIVIERH